MLAITPQMRILVAVEAVDFRKGIDSLAELCRAKLNADPFSVRHFVQQFSQRNNRVINSIPSETMEALVRYHWPGNIRELQNVIERAVIISKSPVLNVALGELEHVPPQGPVRLRPKPLSPSRRTLMLS